VTEAIALADDLGAEPIATQARSLARRARLVEEPAEAAENGWGLTSREVEVLRLLARGLSTKQIGAELVITPKTADSHIQHVYSKIGVSTRAAATIFAMRHDLVDAGQGSGELPM